MTITPKVRDWLYFLCVPMLLTAPGAVLAGFLLSGGKIVEVPLEVAAICAANTFATLFTLTGFPIEGSARLSRMARTMIHWLAALMALIFSSVHPAAFLAVLAAVLLGGLELRFQQKSRLRPFCCSLRIVFGILAGAVLCLSRTKSAGLIPFADLFALGVFFYIFGVERAGTVHTVKLEKRPGSIPLLSGAILCYLITFLRLGPNREGTFVSYLPAVLTALITAVALILAWKAFRLFRKPALPPIVQEFLAVLRCENWIFMQAASCAACRAWIPALGLLMLAFAARALSVKLKAVY